MTAQASAGGGGIQSFNGRSAPAAVLSKADVTGLGLAAADVGADAAGAAAAAVAALVNSAPSTLDTLGEIATQLGSDESAAAALATTVGQKANQAAILAALGAPQTTMAASGNLTANTLQPISGASANVSVALPAPGTPGRLIVTERVDDPSAGGAGTVTVTGTIRGSAGSFPFKLLNESVAWVDLGTTWWPFAGHKTLSALDARYDLLGAAAAEQTRALAAEVGMVKGKTRDRSRVAAAYPPALASPPSVVQGASNAATSIASGTDHPTFPSSTPSNDFTFVGRHYALGGQDATACIIGAGSSVAPPAPNVTQTAYPSYSGNNGNTHVEFWTDAPQLEIVCRGDGASVVVFMDDQFLGVYDMPGGSGANRIYVGGTTAIPAVAGGHTFRVEGNGTALRNVRVPVGYGIGPTEQAGPKLVIVGDSFVVATVLTDADRSSSGGFSQNIGYPLGMPNSIGQGISGTGLLNTQGGTRPTYRQRIGDLIAESPDIVWVWGSVNDFGQTQTAIQAEMTSYIAAIQSALPKALLFATGPPDMVGSGANGLNVVAVEQGMQPACTAAGIPFLPLRTIAPMTGTGYVGHTVGDGNRDRYTGPDDVHPAGAGFAYLTKRGAPAIETQVLAGTRWG